MVDRKQFQILLVEDSPTSAELANYWLEDGLKTPFFLHKVTHLVAALEILGQGLIDLAILDLNLPDSFGLETFCQVHKHSPEIPVVILSGEAEEELAVEAVRLGAQDYVVKENGAKNPLARPVLFAWERAQRHRAEASLNENERQLFVARAVQEHLLPDAPPALEGFDIAAHCQPVELIGGDYYDFMPLPDDAWALVIADVCGHGMAAALLSVEVRAVLRSLARTYSTLTDILEVANELISPDLHERFVTAFFARLDPAARKLQYGSAGHPALLLNSAGEVRELPALTAPIGVHDGEIEVSTEIILSEGDLLVLYTDGLTERFDPQDDISGMSRVLDSLRENRHRPAAEIVEGVFQMIRDFSGVVAQTDDETLVVVKVGTATASTQQDDVFGEVVS